MTQPLVLGFGASAIDDIIYVDHRLVDGKGRILRRERDFGGNVATALVAVAKLGGRASFIGWVGETPEGDPGAAEMARAGVDLSSAPTRADASPIVSTIFVGPDGDRFIAYDDGVPHGTSDDLPDAVLAEGCILLVDGYATHSLAIVERARAIGLVVVSDIESSVGTRTERLISLSDHLVLPISFARSAVGDADVATMLDRLWSDDRSAVVLTDGARGAFVKQRGSDVLLHLPAHPVTAVDTTGAGDCFHGAYVLGLAEGRTPIESVRFAAAASACSVMGRGGRAALPNRDQCLVMLRRPDAPLPMAIVAAR